MTKAVLALYQNSSFGWLQWLLLMGTFWPVWQWYFERLTDPSDEPLGIIAVLTLLALGAYRYQLANNKNNNADKRWSKSSEVTRHQIQKRRSQS